LGSEILAAQPDDEDVNLVRGKVMDIVKASFRPEFLNRIDEIILFRRLSKADTAGIVDIQFARLVARLAERGINLKLDKSAREWLAENGYDPIYGARPLKRLIQSEVENPLALEILSGNIKEGDNVVLREKSGRLAFGK